MVRCRSYLLATLFGSMESMNEADIVLNVRQLAVDLRTLTPAQAMEGTAYKSLASVPGKGGALTQWFNRETNQPRKRIISDLLGLVARASYQQKPEFYQTTASELEQLCDRLDGKE